MTEFELIENCVLGLMPWTNISRLLNRPASNPSNDALLAEVYLLVEDPERYHARALTTGAKELSPLAPRDWGHMVAYSVDWDGHVIAFAAQNR